MMEWAIENLVIDIISNVIAFIIEKNNLSG